MDQLLKNLNAKFLFIGGPPRSGTTLLVNLLDSHPEFLVFPSEHSTLERYYWNKNNINNYALTDFIFKRQEGQQSILANQELLKQYSEKIKKEYNIDFSLDIKSEIFVQSYLQSLKNIKEISLKDILSSLIFAVANSNDYAKSKYSTAKYFVFKQPYYTDLFATEVIKYIPDAKFINIYRDPISRYTSAKKRRLSVYSINKKLFYNVNGINFTEAHSEVDISCYNLAKENQEILGNSRYKIMNYEDLLTKQNQVFGDLFKWLSVSNSDCYLNPTLLGKPALAGSTFIKKEGVDKSGVNREIEYKKITSWNERIAHRFYLGEGKLSSKKPSFLIFLASYLLPFKHEPLPHYIYKLSQIYRVFLRHNLKSRLPEGVKKRKLTLSGTI